MQALLERMMPVDYKTLHTVKSLALRIAGGQVRAAGQHRDQTEPHATRARDAACARCKIFFHGGRIEIPSMCQQSLRSVALSFLAGAGTAKDFCWWDLDGVVVVVVQW